MFTLKIPVTSASLDAIKAELTRTLPEVKSSHRCEAVARGLGFRTYAALREATKAPNPIIAVVQSSAFVAYLAEHGFEVRPIPFYRAVTRVALRSVLEKVPKLTKAGIGIGELHRKPDGSRGNSQECEAKFATAREELLNDGMVEPFLLSLALLSRVKPTKTIRQGTGSYKLKHVAERHACTYPDGSQLGPQYVPNGVFIAAAVHAGFNIKTYVDALRQDSPNVSFNMSKESLENLGC